jgi:hypothetical protein
MKKVILLLTAGGVIVIGVVAGTYWVISNNDNINQVKDSLSSPSQLVEQAKQAALKQAQSFKPEGICAMTMTKARHQATGLEYTFPSACLPGGWEIIR